MFDGMVRLSEAEDGIVMSVTVPVEIEQCPLCSSKEANERRCLLIPLVEDTDHPGCHPGSDCSLCRDEWHSLGQPAARMASFNLAFGRVSFMKFLKRAGDFFQMTEPEDSRHEYDKEGEIPYGPEGTCPECDAHQGINAKGKVRKCSTCDYVWKVRG